MTVTVVGRKNNGRGLFILAVVALWEKGIKYVSRGSYFLKRSWRGEEYRCSLIYIPSVTATTKLKKFFIMKDSTAQHWEYNYINMKVTVIYTNCVLLNKNCCFSCQFLFLFDVVTKL